MRKKVIVYGAGNNFTRNYNWIKTNYEIVGLVDGSKSKIGENIGNFEVKSIDNILHIEYDFILISPNVYQSIKKALLEKGVAADKMLSLVEEIHMVQMGDKLRIAFSMDGGVGDLLINLNYIYLFVLKYGKTNLQIDIDAGRSRKLLDQLLDYSEFIDCVYNINEVSQESYDLYIHILRYPEIIYVNKKRIAKIYPDMLNYVFECEKFALLNPRYFDKSFNADGCSAMQEEIFHRKRIQQPDINGFLGVKEVFSLPISVKESYKTLEKYFLFSKQYITIHRGCEEKNYQNSSTKLWNAQYYDRLIDLIKTETDMKIVLVGSEYEENLEISRQDIDLIGKTTIEEIKVILKNSFLHIDTEGGLVHLRHALDGGISVVIFGPTSDEFFGYSENINIRTGACPYPCEWMTIDWMKECLRENDKRICMESVLPESVMKKIQEMGILKWQKIN